MLYFKVNVYFNVILNVQFEGRKTQMVFSFKSYYNNFWASYHEMPIFMVQA